MRFPTPRFLVLLLLTAGLFGRSTPARAQTYWLPETFQSGISVSWLKPLFTGDDVATPSSALYLHGRWQATDRLQVRGEWALSYIRFTTDLARKHNVTVGNPYLGIVYQLSASHVAVEAGARAPLASESAGFITGLFADYDHLEAFLPDVLSVRVAGRYRSVGDGPVGLEVALGGIGLLSVDPGQPDDDLYGTYRALAWYQRPLGRIGVGLTGLVRMTEDDLRLRERTVHHLGFAMHLQRGAVQPGLQVRLPLDEDLRDFIDAVVGVSLSVPIP